jgi:hypothetical protein
MYFTLVPPCGLSGLYSAYSTNGAAAKSTMAGSDC